MRFFLYFSARGRFIIYLIDCYKKKKVVIKNAESKSDFVERPFRSAEQNRFLTGAFFIIRRNFNVKNC